MLNQIKADLMRMRKSRLTYVLLTGQLIITLLIIRTYYRDYVDQVWMDPLTPEEICLEMLCLFGQISGFMSAFISLKLTILEKKDGLLRNKLITGCGRCGIFFSKVIVNYLISVILLVIHMAAIIISSQLLYKGQLPDTGTLVKIAAIYLMWLFFISVMMAVIALCLSSEILSIILSFVIVGVLPSLPETLQERIILPQYQGTFILEVFKFLRRITPYTYMSGLTNASAVSKAFTDGIIPCIAMILVLGFAGIIAFRRKDFN